MPRRAHGHREKPREISDRALRKIEREVGIAQPPTRVEEPELIVASNTELVNRARSFVSQVAIKAVTSERARVRGGYGYPNSLFGEEGLLAETFRVWGRPGVLERSGDNRFIWSSSIYRSQVAAAICLEGMELRPSKLHRLANDTFGAASAVIDTLGYDREIRRSFTTGDDYHTVAHMLDRNRLTDPDHQEAPADRAALRTQATQIFAERIASESPKDQQRLTSLFAGLLGVWTGPNAYVAAEGARRHYPEGSYQRNIELIDWQLVMAQKAQREDIPDSAISHVTASIQAACVEQGLDYMALNSIPQRREQGFSIAFTSTQPYNEF